MDTYSNKFQWRPTSVIRQLTTIVVISLVLLSLFQCCNAKTGIMAPLYMYPGPQWEQVVQAQKAYPSVPMVAIANPDNGPGQSQDSNYVSKISELQLDEILVIGYVATGYGKEPIANVMADIDTWYRYYPKIQGIFFDQMANVTGYESYYSNLTKYVNQAIINGAFTVGNVGTQTQTSYVGIMSNIVIYDDQGMPSIDTLDQRCVGNGAFSYWAYDVSSLNVTAISMTSQYVGYLYVSNAVVTSNNPTMTTPWLYVPPYLNELASILNGNSMTSASLTTTTSSKNTNANQKASSADVMIGQFILITCLTVMSSVFVRF